MCSMCSMCSEVSITIDNTSFFTEHITEHIEV
jgi:hypothetical protein